MNRLTERHYVEKDGYYLKCSGEPSCPENCEECNRLDEAIDRLGAYEDTGLPPEVCANYKTFEDECISKGVTFSRIVELMNADAEGRLKIVPRAPKGTVCGNCVHFGRETGTAHGFCKTQTQMRVSAEFPSGRTEPRYVMQSRPACKGYEPLEEDDDGATD